MSDIQSPLQTLEPEMSIAEIRSILGEESECMSDEEVLMLNKECRSFASLVCDIAIASPAHRGRLMKGAA